MEIPMHVFRVMYAFKILEKQLKPVLFGLGLFLVILKLFYQKRSYWANQ